MVSFLNALIFNISLITNYINMYRYCHQSPNIIYDIEIESYAQNWADYLLLNGKFEHSDSKLYGENLFYLYQSSITNLTPTDIIKKAIDSWYNENTLYDYKKNIFQPDAGHFTALVWKSTKKYGIGYASNGKTTIITMNFSPPGNVQNQFIYNVFSKK